MDRLFREFYGLIEQPFGVTPDTRFLYLGSKHRQALDVLNYGTQLNRGFLTLTAKPGMGKTTLLYHYLEGLRDKARTVFLFQTDCDPASLMRYLLAELGIASRGMDLPEMRAELGQVLLRDVEAGRRFVLVIDEAQNLNESVLESVRLLSNFEKPWMKLMQIVLSGQPELDQRLAKRSMDQLRQRISFTIRIEPFTREETDQYIDHRLWVAGYKGPQLFSAGARALIAERSEGIPRIINNICFCAMSYSWALKAKTVDRDMISEVLADMDTVSPGEPEKPIFSPIQPEEPVRSIPQLRQPSGLTLKHRPAMGISPTVVAVCILGIVLGTIGLQPNVEKWIGASLSSVSTGVKNFLVPAPDADSTNPSPTVAPDPSLPSPKVQGLKDEKNIKAPNRDGEESSLAGRSN
ncbi:MAG TPA: AAA family ATPase [Candidatus Acidoferrales bacterium]